MERRLNRAGGRVRRGRLASRVRAGALSARNACEPLSNDCRELQRLQPLRPGRNAATSPSNSEKHATAEQASFGGGASDIAR